MKRRSYLCSIGVSTAVFACGSDSGSRRDGGDTMTGLCVPAEVRDCYTPPAYTLAYGPCRAGRQTCSAVGHWGACTGQVVPTELEVCGDAIDDNCNGDLIDGCAAGDASVGDVAR